MKRSILHPGTPLPKRYRSVECRSQRLSLHLPADRSINDAIASALAEAGFPGGYVRLKNATVSPMHYVIPAPAPDREHAAWYSGTFSPDGATIIEDAGVIAGWRDGKPFIHCHGIWREPDGTRRMGHLLPLDSAFAEPVEAEALAISGAIFDARDDTETNFKLFSPEAVVGSTAKDGCRALLCTVRPNEDICLAIETICRTHGINHASIKGIGSLVGADFEDGAHVASYATELLIKKGIVSAIDGEPRCTLDIAIVDIEGAIHEGRLIREENPVCVTFELLIKEQQGPPPA